MFQLYFEIPRFPEYMRLSCDLHLHFFRSGYSVCYFCSLARQCLVSLSVLSRLRHQNTMLIQNLLYFIVDLYRPVAVVTCKKTVPLTSE